MNVLRHLQHPIISILVFGIVAFLIYGSILNNVFLSDDYDSLYRIIVEKNILIRYFFRPIIDISFLINYRLSGLNPAGFYIFNILVHVVNTYMVFSVAKKYQVFDSARQIQFAFLSAVLFLLYPFHNEAIVWLSGRISSIACSFALIALNIYLSDLSVFKKMIWSALCYLMGLLSYESILFLPFILLLIGLREYSRRNFLLQIIFWLGVMAAYVSLRFYFSGAVYGEYGERMVTGSGIKDYMIRFLKVFGRTLLPPAENSNMQIVLFIIVSLFIGGYFFFKRNVLDIKFTLSDSFVKLAGCFLVALSIPVLFGISTRTAEGDRLLYFPSVFLCLMISFVILKSKLNRVWAILSIGAVLFYFVYFLQKNNRQWNKASVAATEILSAIKNSSVNKVILINLPDELEGAFVFRNGFERFMVLSGIDTSAVELTNYLFRKDYLLTGEKIYPHKTKDTIFIYPETQVTNDQTDNFRIVNVKNHSVTIASKKNSIIYYWDKTELKKLF